MSRELYLKKLEQMLELLRELERLLDRPLSEYAADLVVTRAAERNFQLLVNLAVDVNLYLVAERTGGTPDSYRQSFLELGRLRILDPGLAQRLARSAQLRNILVHEYDFDADVTTFHGSARGFLPDYDRYLAAIHRCLET
jgi:uncharacterized protein YutE (UPF0331/DUF86 family)